MSPSTRQLALAVAMLRMVWCGDCQNPAAKQGEIAESCDSEQALLQNRFHHSVTVIEEEGVEDAGADDENSENHTYNEELEEDDTDSEDAEEPTASFSEMNTSEYGPPEAYKARTDICFNYYPKKGYFCWHPALKDDPKHCSESITSVALPWNQDWFVMKDEGSGSSCTKANTQGKGQKMICGFRDGRIVRKCGNGVECIKGKCSEAAKQKHWWHPGAAVNKLCEGNEVGKTDGPSSVMACKMKCEALGEKCNGFNKLKSGPDRGKCAFFSEPKPGECHKQSCPACKDDKTSNVYTIYRRDVQRTQR
eukprot:gnl/MRDRNA2_/MRDRNA2_109803_c0_seq1.p1 gnl/MRDRNA2_/MRDRNA2_109803_c0~~gnl/MRDRNA2_/MRDRNA2_109803_c0_seq1.p1  ORF type:complete len:307 (-),score=80.11 gnl/MRDRNA2_/MRDRNA2_109803_c0_seq1:178-1098(-)